MLFMWASEFVKRDLLTGLELEYPVEYNHTSPDVDDVRVAFLFGDRDQTILLDRIALRGYRQ